MQALTINNHINSIIFNNAPPAPIPGPRVLQFTDSLKWFSGDKAGNTRVRTNVTLDNGAPPLSKSVFDKINCQKSTFRESLIYKMYVYCLFYSRFADFLVLLIPVRKFKNHYSSGICL